MVAVFSSSLLHKLKRREPSVLFSLAKTADRVNAPAKKERREEMGGRGEDVGTHPEKDGHHHEWHVALHGGGFFPS